jgi:hypothetical protein
MLSIVLIAIEASYGGIAGTSEAIFHFEFEPQRKIGID